MPAHDWTRVSQGIFHDFHNSWVVAVKDLLNSGVLPWNYYALTEQVAGETAPDVIALEIVRRSERRLVHTGKESVENAASGVLSPPRAFMVARAENPSYASLRRTVVIRHSEDHSVVALVEILSKANKASRAELERFLTKGQSALKQHIHLLIVDLYPPGRLDPLGIHGALWTALAQPPPEGGQAAPSYVEPFRVGDDLPDMPLFLGSEGHVMVPLEVSYAEAFRSVPAYWRERIEAG